MSCSAVTDAVCFSRFVRSSSIPALSQRRASRDAVRAARTGVDGQSCPHAHHFDSMGTDTGRMQNVGRSDVGQFNARHRNGGTLWEGRYNGVPGGERQRWTALPPIHRLQPIAHHMTNDQTNSLLSGRSTHCEQRSIAFSLLIRHSAHVAGRHIRCARRCIPAAAVRSSVRRRTDNDSISSPEAAGFGP